MGQALFPGSQLPPHSPAEQPCDHRLRQALLPEAPALPKDSDMALSLCCIWLLLLQSLSLAGAAMEEPRVPGQELVPRRRLASQRQAGSSVVSPASWQRPDARSMVRRLLGGLEAVGVLPMVGSSPHRAPRQSRGSRSRVSGFLHNVSAQLETQELGGLPWKSLLQRLLPQAPLALALQLRDVQLSLRGSPAWDTLLSLTQGLLGTPQPSGARLLAGGWQGSGCALVGRRSCRPGAHWGSQLLKLFEGSSWKPSVHLQPAGAALAPGHFQPLRVLPGASRQPSPPAGSPLPPARPQQPGPGAAGGSTDTLWGALEEATQWLLRRMGRSLYAGVRRKVSRVTGLLLDEVSTALGVPEPDREGKCSGGTLPQLLLWGMRRSSWNARSLGFRSRTLPSPPPALSCLQPAQGPPPLTERASGEPWPSAEALESACSDALPGLPGISNFTVYLYCRLANGSAGAGQPPSDLAAACSSAAWYVASARGDSLWVQACREHFASQFHATVCSNASLLRLPGPHQPLLQQLCASLPLPPVGGSCLEGLPEALGAHWLCSNGSLCGLGHQLLGGSEPHQARRNASLLEQCGGASFQELLCENSSLVAPEGPAQPWLRERCPGSPPNGPCSLHLLPVPAGLDASRLCRDPAPYLLGLVAQLPHCQEPPSRWILSMNYVLRLLDFALPHSELGQAARDQLSEAILLSSLLDNGSWAGLAGDSSRSILQAVGQYLQQQHQASDKHQLLSCFSPVLWELLQREEGALALAVLVQEYLRMPQETFQQLLLSAESEAVQGFLALLHRAWHRLQGPIWTEPALQHLASRLLRRFPQLTPQLVVLLSPLAPFMAVSDILRIPPALLANESVLAALRSHSAHMRLVQKSTLAKLLLQAQRLGDVPTWRPGLLRTIQPLLPHLPLRRFVQLTPLQIQGLAGGWQDVRLGLAQGRHVARSLLNVSWGAAEEQVQRLGGLACYLSPEELQALAPLRDPLGLVEQSLLACAANGVLPPHGQVAYALADLWRSASLAAVGPQELRAWRGILPELGVRLLQRLSATQLRALLPELQAAQLTPAQASVLLTRAVRLENVTEGVVSRLCPLLPGLGPESLQASPIPALAQACECLAPTLPRLSAPQRAALLQALQGLRHGRPARSLWPDCLLPWVPLKLLQLDSATLLRESSRFGELPWAPQQAQFLWREVAAGTNVSLETVRALGTLGAGLGCASLQRFGQRADFLGVLRALYACPSSLPGSLRRCVWEEVRRRPALSEEELLWLGPKFLVDLPVKLVDKLPNDSVRLILDYVSSHPQSLLALPPHRRAALAHRALRLLAPAEGELPGEVLDLLGPLLGFLGQEAAAHIQPESLLLRLEELQAACLAEGFAEELGRLLLTEQVLGQPRRWTALDVQQLGRLVFLLPAESVRLIPREVLSRDTLEQLLQSQREWEQSEPGRLCHSPGAQGRMSGQKEALVAWLVRSSLPGIPDPVPSCADIRATFPAAWSAAQLASMAPAHFEGCLGLISQDPGLSPRQRRAALGRAKQLFGAAGPRQTIHLLQLGVLATELGEQELQELELSDWGALSVLGGLGGWTARQMRAAVSSFLRQSGRSVQGLALPDLAALGHLLCGLRAHELRLLNSQELSQAAPFLGSLKLSCSEPQLEALADLLTARSAFGPVSSWGPEIFTEIGSLAAGLQDIALSSLVPEQIQALTPLAVMLIPPPKLAVVFSPAQLLDFTSAQAAAVTPQQRVLLSAEQRRAVASAQFEGEVAQDGRGRNLAQPRPGPSALALLCLTYSLG